VAKLTGTEVLKETANRRPTG